MVLATNAYPSLSCTHAGDAQVCKKICLRMAANVTPTRDGQWPGMLCPDCDQWPVSELLSWILTWGALLGNSNTVPCHQAARPKLSSVLPFPLFFCWGSNPQFYRAMNPQKSIENDYYHPLSSYHDWYRSPHRKEARGWYRKCLVCFGIRITTRELYGGSKRSAASPQVRQKDNLKTQHIYSDAITLKQRERAHNK
jgi:hypothetical protein